MKTGTDEIKHLILRALKKHGAILKGIRYGEFADDLTSKIVELVGDDMSKKDFDLTYNFPEELNPIVRQLESGLGVMMMKDENAIEVYRWLAEQGKDKIKTFIQWATAKERAQFVGKYRRSPGLIKTEWKLAINETTKITINNDGSLYV